MQETSREPLARPAAQCAEMGSEAKVPSPGKEFPEVSHKGWWVRLTGGLKDETPHTKWWTLIKRQLIK